jgi:hypothetical protein
LAKNGRFITKTLAFVIIFLIIGISIQPAIATIEPEEKIIDVEPKDYLFQTIIELANNQEVNNLLIQQKFNLFNVDIDQEIIRKIFFSNPRVIHSLMITKLANTQNNLNWIYNQGIHIIDIIGEDTALNILEQVKIKDKLVFEELNFIIEDDEVLYDNINNLVKLNSEMVPKNISDILSGLVCGICIVIFIAILVTISLINIPVELVLNLLSIIPNENWNKFLTQINFFFIKLYVTMILVSTLLMIIGCGIEFDPYYWYLFKEYS